MTHRVTDALAHENRLAALAASTLNPAEQQAAIDLALTVLADRHRAGTPLGSVEDTRAYLRLLLAERPCEVFGALFLDSQHRIVDVAELFQGTLDAAVVYPRVVVQRALAANAAALILFHNHPSGVAEPSRADQAITQRLKDALSLIDVRLLDHIVVAAGASVSLAERGLL